MLKRMVETEKGRVYFRTYEYNDGSRRYGAYLNLKTNIGGFTIMDKMFNSFCEAACHYEQLKFDLNNYDCDPQSYIRMFV